jgi:phosphonate transport system substrate-binding protein
MKKSYWCFIGLVWLIFLSCNQNNKEKVVIDFNSPTQDSISISFHEDEAVHVAIATISSPRESYNYYNELLQYIAAKIQIPIHSVQKQSSEEVNQLLHEGAVDFAFISSGAYIEFNTDKDLDILAAPVIENKQQYRAYLITNEHNDVQSFEELEGLTFAYSDPLSHTGYNYPIYQIKNLGKDPEAFFSKSIFSFGHDFSIEMVNKEVVDAAYVDGLIYDYLSKYSKDKINNTRIIEVSEAFGIPPVVCPKKLDKKRFDLYQEIFLNLHNEARGREILNRLNIDRYEKGKDEMYDGIREIKNKAFNEKA